MFTGIIESIGELLNLSKRGEGHFLSVKNPKKFEDLKEGASICVNGACLTVLKFGDSGKAQTIDFELSSETFAKTGFSDLKSGSFVNLERALSLSGRIDGHLVSGHVDGIVEVKTIADESGGGKRFTFGFEDASLGNFLIEKGSAAINGVSLTVFGVKARSFDAAVLPYTLTNTNLGLAKRGDRVNFESDLLGKYIQKFSAKGAKGSAIDRKFLAEHGFMGGD